MRKGADELFLIRIVAKPNPENQEASEAGGAYVICWVDADDLTTAETRAIEAIEGERWQSMKFDHWELVSRRSYVENPEHDEGKRRELLESVDEAFKHGLSFTFFCWAIDATEV